MTLHAFTNCDESGRTAEIGRRQTSLWRPLAMKDSPDIPEKTEPAPQEEGACSPTNKTLTDALTSLEAARAEIELRTHQLEQHFRNESTAMLARIVSAAAPSICEAAARDAIAMIFNEARMGLGEEVVSIVVSPDLFDLVQMECAQRSVTPPVDVDQTLEAGAMRVRCPGGGLDCDIGHSLFAIVEFLSSPTQTEGQSNP
jgi:hypothetical protein